MKKLIIMSLYVAFISSSVYAQENTYSMIIKMANSTTLVISPNEVDSISFNDGQMSVTGQSISSLIDDIAEMRKDLEYKVAKVLEELEASKATIQDLEKRLENLQSNTLANIEIRDGFWFINGENTNVRAEGKDGKDGANGQDGRDADIWRIGSDGYWYLNGVKTEYRAVGYDGQNGANGRDGRDGRDADIWRIGNDGYWYLNGVKTEYRAIGYDGQNGANGQDGRDADIWRIGSDGYWYVNGIKTEYRAIP